MAGKNPNEGFYRLVPLTTAAKKKIIKQYFSQVS